MSEKRVTLAAIAGAHGIGGEVRLKLFSESLDSFKGFKTFEAAGRTLTLKSVRATGKMPIARFAEIADRNQAEALRGAELTVSRNALPPIGEGEYYHADVIGLPCETADGDRVGTIIAIEDFGAGDVFEIEPTDGKRFMVPHHALAIGEERAVLNNDFMP